MADKTAHLEPLAGLDLFIEAAWTHARTFMAERQFVPDVMVLGRYVDEELLFVFPSSQDKETFQHACAQEALNFGADVAMLVGEGVFGPDGEEGQPIVKVLFRERGAPIRAQIAHIGEAVEPASRTVGPVSSVPGTHDEYLLNAVFGPEVMH